MLHSINRDEHSALPPNYVPSWIRVIYQIWRIKPNLNQRRAKGMRRELHTTRTLPHVVVPHVRASQRSRRAIPDLAGSDRSMVDVVRALPAHR